MTNPRFLTLLSLVLTGLFFGLPPILLKLILREFNTFTTVFIRSLFALLFVIPIVIPKKAHLVQKKDLLKIIFVSLLPAGNVILFIIGLQFTTAIISNLMYCLVPINTLLLTKLLLKEKLSLYKILGIFLGFSGALIILLYPLISTNQSLILSIGTSKGNFIIFLAGILWTLYLLLSKKLSQKYSPLTLSFFSFLSIPIISSFPTLLEVISHSSLKQTPSSLGLFSFFILIIFATITPIFLNQWTVKHASPVTASFATYLSLTTTTALAIVFLAEKITLPFLFGSFLIILGVFLATTFPHLKKV
jgi:drug/metabolite transporter (DMT)-like permease